MAITAITIENFKGIRDPIRIEFKPITLLFGPNSAGKSTIVQALHYAREIFGRRNLDPDTTIAGGKAVNLGGFKTLIYNNDLMRTVSFRIDLDLSKTDLSDYLARPIFEDLDNEQSISSIGNEIYECLSKVNSAWVKCNLIWDKDQEIPVVDTYSVGVNGDILLEINRLTTSPYPCKIILYPHQIMQGVIKDQRGYEHIIDEEEKLVDEYLCGKTFQATDEDWKVHEHERELLKQYDQAKERCEKEWEELDGIPDFIHEIEMFLNQDSALPEWDEHIEFINPFWDVELESEGQLYRNLLDALILGPGIILCEELDNMSYLGPIRDLPSRNHIPALSPDKSRWADGLAAWDALYTAKDDFIEELNFWLTDEDGLNTGYEVERKIFKELDANSEVWITLMRRSYLDEEKDIKDMLVSLPEKVRLYLKDRESGIEVMPQDIGVGVSQVLPVLVLALHHKSGMVAIEQPELHVHPAIQVALGDLFISQIQKKERLFLLETHSEHLMLRLLRRIRETDENELPPGKFPLHPEQLAVYFVEQSPTGITVTPIRISQEGEFIDRWPRGFFSERMEELF